MINCNYFLFQFISHFQKCEGKQYIGSYAYTSDNSDDLCFNEGDVISDCVEVGDGWMKGTINGKTGMFPAGYATPYTQGTERNL